MNIVPTNIPYTYSLMRQNLTLLKSRFPFIRVELAGRSVLKRNIYVVRLGKGPRSVFYSASIHANEYITSILLMKFIENYCDAFVGKASLNGISIADLYNSTSIYIMPMVNPDGVDLVNGVFAKNSYPYIKAKGISDEFKNIAFPNGWKANINRHRFEPTISCRLGASKKNKICSRL